MQIIDKWKWYELIDDQMQIMINEIFNIFKKCFFLKNHVITLLKMKRDDLKNCIMSFSVFVIVFPVLEVLMLQVGVTYVQECLLRTKVSMFIWKVSFKLFVWMKKRFYKVVQFAFERCWRLWYHLASPFITST